MIKMSKFLVYMILSVAIFGCGGSQEGLVLENETDDSILAKGVSAYEAGNFDQSIELSQLMLNSFPTSDLHIDAQLLIAKSMGAKEKYEDQFDLLLRILKENIIPEKVPMIYMQIGEFYENSARWNPGTVTSDTVDFSKAAGYYKKAVFYPDSKDEAIKANALYRMALMYAKINEIEIASKAYQELITTYPASPYSTLARQKLNNPSNTEELPLPTPTGITDLQATPEVTTQPGEQPVITPVSDKPEKLEDAPPQIELPSDDAEEPSILDSLQTIDDEPSIPEDE